jgi:lipopolysaccharide transport system permease protein
MLLFTFVFGRLANLPSENVPYSLFVYSGLLPWLLFSSGLTGASSSIVGNARVLDNVYFPRLIIPLAAVLSALVDFIVAFSVLIGLMAYYGFAPGLAVLALPLYTLFALATAFAVGLWLSMLNVKYRDVQHTIPFMMQIWLFATPVAYASNLIPPKYRLLFGLNPMTSVIDGFRWALLGREPKFGMTLVASVLMVFVVLIGGLVFFRRTERTVTDVL